jgi:uncharacterized protein (DUF58 family)
MATRAANPAERHERLALWAARAAGPACLRRRVDAPRDDERTDYVVGDDYRQVDWHLCARHDELRTRPAPPHENAHLHVMLDCSRSMAAGDEQKFALARQLALELALVALAGGAAVGAAALGPTLGADLPPRRGRAQQVALTEFFSRREANTTTDLLASVESLLARHRAPGLAVVISDFLDPRGFVPALERLRQANCEPFAVHIVAPADADPAWRGPVELIDAETGAQRRFHCRPADLIRYRRRFARFCSSLERYCAQRELGWCRIDAGQGVDAALRQVLRPANWTARGRRPT